MALQKEIPQPNGSKPSYWRPVQVTINYDREDVTIDVAGYLTVDDDRNGYTPVANLPQYIKDLSQVPEIRDTLYQLIKESQLDENGNETNILADAVDLI